MHSSLEEKVFNESESQMVKAIYGEGEYRLSDGKNERMKDKMYKDKKPFLYNRDIGVSPLFFTGQIYQ